MSGTAFGTIVLHADPEAAVGGPLAMVENGDTITLNVPERQLTLNISDDEYERRRARWSPPEHTKADRGYRKLFMDTVNQAGEGVDFDFLTQRPFMDKTP